jgi:DNA-binding protein HU-beta
VSRLTARLDGDRATAMTAVNGVLEEIEQSLARGEKVSLFGFGTFDRRERGPRAARNPATGETIQVGASVAPVFRAGTGLKQLLAEAAGTARTAATQAASAATAVPATAVSVTASATEAAKKAARKAAKQATKKAASEASKASSKATKAKATKADAGTGKSSKKASGKSTKKR